MTEKVEQLLKVLGPVNDETTRAKVGAVLWTRVVAGIENEDKDWKKMGYSNTLPAWEKVDKYLATLAERDPAEAFSLAVELVLMPRSFDPERERVNPWLRADGLTLLGLDGMNRRLDVHLALGPYRAELHETLVLNMRNNISAFTTVKDFGNPKGFTTVQSVFIGLGLETCKSELGKSLFVLAHARKTDRDISLATKILAEEDGCDYLKKRI